jgi:hypothetical protein
MYHTGRNFFILMGLILGIFGVLIIIDPAFYSSYLHQYVDLSDVRWQVGLFFIVLGVLFVGSSFRKKAVEAENEYKDQIKVLMCPSCVKPFQKKNVPELKCPECERNLEDLVGFYDRHPELKEDET